MSKSKETKKPRAVVTPGFRPNFVRSKPRKQVTGGSYRRSKGGKHGLPPQIPQPLPVHIRRMLDVRMKMILGIR